MSHISNWLLVSILVCLSPTPGMAQGSPSELAAAVSSDVRAIDAFDVIERAALQVDHAVAYAIIATSGGWSKFDGAGDDPAGNAYYLRRNVEDQNGAVIRAAATIARSNTATETEKDNATDAVAELNVAFDSALMIAGLLEAGDPAGAMNIYLQSFNEPQQAAIRLAYTGASSTSSRLNMTITAIRMLE